MIDMCALNRAMHETEQAPGLTIYCHGLSVASYFTDLYCHLKHGTKLREQWRLPNWITPSLLDRCELPHVMTKYLIWHDCGKPFCKTINEDGKVSFPNHSQISHDMWLAAGGEPEIAQLMLMDMDIHTLKSDGLEEFAKRPQAISLILSGLCAIHSNAEMFGGIDSTSFKIKWKHIDKRGRQILQLINGA